jgi:hypothetical protein
MYNGDLVQAKQIFAKSRSVKIDRMIVLKKDDLAVNIIFRNKIINRNDIELAIRSLVSHNSIFLL